MILWPSYCLSSVCGKKLFALLISCLVVRCGVLTVEIEHVDVATMEKLEQQGVDCQPKASTIRIIQVCLSSFIQQFGFMIMFCFEHSQSPLVWLTAISMNFQLILP